MISFEQINAEIAALEEEKPSYQSMEKLANMYVVRDHMLGTRDTSGKTVIQSLPSIDSESDFAKKIHGKDAVSVLFLVDDLMTALMVVNPRLYECFMRKL